MPRLLWWRTLQGVCQSCGSTDEGLARGEEGREGPLVRPGVDSRPASLALSSSAAPDGSLSPQ